MHMHVHEFTTLFVQYKKRRYSLTKKQTVCPLYRNLYLLIL